MSYSKEILKDIFQWDWVNWSRALSFWERHAGLNNGNRRCLELGSRGGGLSLWLALEGNSVICSDLESPEEEARSLHEKYRVTGRITYRAVNALDIPYRDHFDCVIFKSILGGIARNGREELIPKTLNGIHNALKKGGVLLYAENLSGGGLHRFFRSRFIRWGTSWNYLEYGRVREYFSRYSGHHYRTSGFWGCFGRTESQRTVLGRIDGLWERLVPERNRYILMGAAVK